MTESAPAGVTVGEYSLSGVVVTCASICLRRDVVAVDVGLRAAARATDVNSTLRPSGVKNGWLS